MAIPAGACDHKQEIGCELTAVPICCGCADQRPLSSAYLTYVDGSGMRMEGTRWQKYCWRCRDHWRSQELAEQRLMRSSLNEQTWSFPSAAPTSTTLSPFAGTQRRNGQGRRHLQRNPLQSSDTAGIGRGYQLREDNSDSNPPWARRQDNYADHTEALPTQAMRQRPDSSEPQSHRRRQNENPFGTREEWEAPDYQSPLAGMFTRAWNRYRDAEVNRRRTDADIEEQMQQLRLDPEASDQPPQPTVHQVRTWTNPWGNVSVDDLVYQSPGTLAEELRRVHNMAEELSNAAGAHGHPNPEARPFYPSAHVYSSLLHAQPLRPRSPSPPRENPIDSQETRPPPLAPEAMTVSIACKICCEQKTDTLLLPCCHVAMCHWCAAIMRTNAAREGRRNGGRRVRGEGWSCPMCRKGVEGIKRVFLG